MAVSVFGGPGRFFVKFYGIISRVTSPMAMAPSYLKGEPVWEIRTRDPQFRSLANKLRSFLISFGGISRKRWDRGR